MTAAPLATRAAEPGAARGGGALAVRRLRLRDFRNYARLELELGPGPVLLVGENGAGKTNLLEAVSLLAPGRGLRRARPSELDRSGVAGPWRLEARVDGRHGPADVASTLAEDRERRAVEQDGAPLRSQNELADLLSVCWLTPAMDRLFLEGASGRRRFLDRLVLGIDPRHAARVSTYERLLRERSHLLRLGRHDPAWLRALERRIAEAGIAVAAARNELARDLGTALAEISPVFPRPRLAVEGEVEGWLASVPALEAEERLAEALARGRALDAGTGGAAAGPHRSDLAAFDAATGEPAPRCSTGRQKAFLVSVVLAQARLRRRRFGDLPVLLLDEVAAHLDQRRREQLLDSLDELGAQAWLTGTDEAFFARLPRGRRRLLHVANGTLRQHDH
jgi:DNA replication and repair protein RecF